MLKTLCEAVAISFFFFAVMVVLACL